MQAIRSDLEKTLAARGPSTYGSRLKAGTTDTPMSILGSRSTLIANVCALIAALVATAEGAYIVHECFGYYRPQDFLGFVFPALVTFIIRNRIFSFCFLALYVALLIQMFYQARSIHLVPYSCRDRLGDPLGNMTLFFVVSVICLAIYPVIALVNFIISLVASKE
jgi:hypothetical protein